MKVARNLRIIALLSLLLASPQLFAHALWIKTKATGEKGKSQPIAIYFGEYADNDITPTAKWFSDLKDFSLTVTAPSKKQYKLKAKALENHYLADFTPTENGTYTVTMQHTVKDVYGTMLLDYNSNATIIVGPNADFEAQNANHISVTTKNSNALKNNNPISIYANYEGNVAKSQKVKVIAPNGWEKELWTNDSGEVTFTPIWIGDYMIEFSQTEKVSGTHNGKPFDEKWKMATSMITIN